MDDLKAFRQLDSKTPGHPEVDHTDGIEVTTGPLGQGELNDAIGDSDDIVLIITGISNAVGLAIAEKHLAATFNKDGFPIIDNKIWSEFESYALQRDT